MKSYSKEDLEKQAQKVFNKYPSTEVLYATTDGQFFLQENRAQLHASNKSLGLPKIITRDLNNIEVAEVTEEKGLSVKELKTLVKATNDNATLEKMLEKENNTEAPRKTAIEAIEARIVELEEKQ